MSTHTKAAQSLATITKLAKAAGQAHKRLSDLTEIQKHAVAFCGYIKPFRINDADPTKLVMVPKKDMDTIEFGAAIGPATMKLQSIIKKEEFMDSGAVNIASKGFCVVIDEELPKFEIASLNAALEAYPEQLFVLDSSLTDYTEGKPPVLPVATKSDKSIYDELHLGLNTILYTWFNPTARATSSIAYATFLIQQFWDEEFITKLRSIAPYFPRKIKDTEINEYDFSYGTPEASYKLPALVTTFKDQRVSAVLWALRGKFVYLKSVE